MRLSALLLLTLALPALFGCGGAPSGSAAGGPEASVALDYSLVGYLGTPAVASSVSSTASFGPQDVFEGVLLVANAYDASDYQTFDWTVYVDGSTFTVESNKTIILFPGTYSFYLLLTNGPQTYAGAAYLKTVVDGQNSIPLTIRPILGNATVDVQLVQELADFRFQYDPTELSGFTSPSLGILVDGGPEQPVALDAGSGLSQSLFINLTPGLHTLQVRFYDQGVQIGRSLASQEQVQIVPGVDVQMDIVALQGETQFVLNESTGDLQLIFTVPAEVVDEAGGLGDLQALLSVVGPSNPLQQVLLSLAAVGDHYEGDTTLSGFQYGDTVSVALAFTDGGDAPPDPLGACLIEDVTIQLGAQTQLCAITLRRRAWIGGNLLATLALNAYTPQYVPVPGAVVYANGEMIGITGSSAFGTAGFLKTFLPAGTHALLATDGIQQGTVIATLLPLSLNNLDLTLDTPTGPG